MKTYPMIQFTVRHGQALALGIAVFLLSIGVYGWLASGHVVCAAGGVALAVAGYFFLRLFVEIVDVIAETLLPR